MRRRHRDTSPGSSAKRTSSRGRAARPRWCGPKTCALRRQRRRAGEALRGRLENLVFLGSHYAARVALDGGKTCAPSPVRSGSEGCRFARGKARTSSCSGRARRRGWCHEPGRGFRIGAHARRVRRHPVRVAAGVRAAAGADRPDDQPGRGAHRLAALHADLFAGSRLQRDARQFPDADFRRALFPRLHQLDPDRRHRRADHVADRLSDGLCARAEFGTACARRLSCSSCCRSGRRF